MSWNSRHSITPPVLKVLHKLAHRLQGGQVQVHHGVGALGHAQPLRRLLGLGKVAAGHNDVPIAALRQRIGGVQAQAGGGTCKGRGKRQLGGRPCRCAAWWRTKAIYTASWQTGSTKQLLGRTGDWDVHHVSRNSKGTMRGGDWKAEAKALHAGQGRQAWHWHSQSAWIYGESLETHR